MKKISIYTKSDGNAAVTYYRFQQYFSLMSDVDVVYRYMIPTKYNNRFLPISKQPILKRAVIFAYVYLRVLIGLLSDLFSCPDIIIISRRLIVKVFPISYILILKMIQIRGIRIIYDFDDSVVMYGEIPRYGFNFLLSISERVIVASNVLKDRIPDKYKSKVLYLPTTDGDIYQKVDKEITKKRSASFDNVIKIIWVGTFPGLEHLGNVVDAIELFGEYLNKRNKKLILYVVCDYKLDYNSRKFELINIKWRRDIAIEKLLEAHIGIMPLRNVMDLCGKGGFKLIQYLSSGLPVVGSAVGINKTIISDEVGRLVDEYNTEQWYSSFVEIVENKNRWENYCINAYNRWIKDYSFNYNKNVWNEILK